MDQKKICATVPKIKNAYCLKELREKKIFLSDVSFKSEKCLYEESVNDIHLSLGANVAGKILTGKIEHLSCGLVAMQYILGWTVMGKVSNEINLDSSYLTLSLFVNEAKITDLWNLDSFGINDPCKKQSKEEVLTRFRMGKICATADIRKAFLPISLNEHDRDYMRFIWWKDGDPEKEIRTLSDPERFLDNCRIERSERALGMLTSEEFDGAEKLILKIVQKEAFTGIEEKRLKSLQPWQDESGLLRIRFIEKRFRIEYLGYLRQSSKHKKEKSQIQVGEKVFVSSDNYKKIDGPLVRVIQLFTSKDGDVRLTKVKIKNGEFLRPIDRLISLELSVELDAPKNLRSRHGLLRKERV
ncbi:integrase catalytic domain-containing protein [Trichonephila clavata]|uniref:Integrase catalytic domain-containing protein n=1 Tax=Trichonephila clavata TaxID=2740835 RepID=A0A8X6L7L3_TRICU|nr:integrase catalytic domain-containing protein [Trichonephila clavata]